LNDDNESLNGSDENMLTDGVSDEPAGEAAARIALGAATIIVMLALLLVSMPGWH
jgi:hypothetical protein